MVQIIRPPIKYRTIAPTGPAVARTSPELRNRPVPIVPPMPVMIVAFIFMPRVRPVLFDMTLSIHVLFSNSIFSPP